MKIAYFDCFSGISGDMILGSLVDAGLDPTLLLNELDKLKGEVVRRREKHERANEEDRRIKGEEGGKKKE